MGSFSVRGSMMAYFNSCPFLSVSKNRSPWKHYASHSLNGNTHDSEPWRMCEYVSKCIFCARGWVHVHQCLSFFPIFFTIFILFHFYKES